MEPAPSTCQRMGKTECAREHGGWRGRALLLAVFAAATVSFAACAATWARHRPRDIGFLAASYYLVALLLCLVWKLETLRLDGRDDAAAADAGETERRQARLALWAVTVALANMLAWRVSMALPFVALRLAVWVGSLVALAFAYYFIFCGKRSDCGDAEQGHGRAQDGAAGCRPEAAFHQMSP